MHFKFLAPKLAKSKRPFAVVYQYSTGNTGAGTVRSTHSTRELAEKSAKASGMDSFLAVRDAREYA